ncbi:DsbA family protein [Streptomyces lichenis]|uniref:DsbA family protein n=1 Tax=Streptomyces lichenis TaxID=2306967 RepID=A0ABT0IGP7_9ACTN|nr:thioredoxin domain-containing protein [Streptomyces lichenis]MCK8680499.1 DsbA family protein [Streptomyces lichenis]
MSDKNNAGKRSARERLQVERERERSRDRRRRTLIVSAAVVGVLGLAAVAGLIAANTGGSSDGSGSGAVSVPSGAAGGEQPSITVGATDAPSTLTVWEDFRCPACAQFENAFRDTVHQLTESGQLKAEYHLATIIDGNMGGSGSLNAANAAACAQDGGKFTAYHDVLYQNQPPEPDDAFAADGKLFELAKKVPGLDTPAFRSCVADGDHDGWVNKSNEAFRSGDFRGTPTVLLNGESVFPTKGNEQISPENLKKWVAEANKGKRPGTATPAPPSPASPAPSASSPAAGQDTGPGNGAGFEE